MLQSVRSVQTISRLGLGFAVCRFERCGLDKADHSRPGTQRAPEASNFIAAELNLEHEATRPHL